jgi:hypothetical protein
MVKKFPGKLYLFPRALSRHRISGSKKHGSLSDKHIDSTDQNEDLVWEVGGTCYSKFVEMGIYISWRVTLKTRINT